MVSLMNKILPTAATAALLSTAIARAATDIAAYDPNMAVAEALGLPCANEAAAR